MRVPRPVPLHEIVTDPGLWLRPTALLHGAVGVRALASGGALSLAGGARVFAACEILSRRSGEILAAVASVRSLRDAAQGGAARIGTQLHALSTPRSPWGGLALDRPLLMGVVNVTPDSFSDGGNFLAREKAIAHARGLLAAGADLVDIGGESTRPGAEPVAPEEELDRILPVVATLAGEGAVVSVDTRHTAVMRAALAAGARIVNDVTALTADGALAAVRDGGGAAVLMHMQGEPQTMQHAPSYTLASLDIADYLAARLAAAEAAGLPRGQLAVDPGIGFGKSQSHNFEILARIALFHATGAAVLLGLSRKSLVGRLAGASVSERLPGSLAGALHAASHGVQILRVHDVAETRQALLFQEAVESGA